MSSRLYRSHYLLLSALPLPATVTCAASLQSASSSCSTVADSATATTAPFTCCFAIAFSAVVVSASGSSPSTRWSSNCGRPLTCSDSDCYLTAAS